MTQIFRTPPFAALDTIIPALHDFIKRAADGDTISPPRHRTAHDRGAMVFTTGGDTAHFGFRAYDTSPGHSHDDQLTACWDQTTGKLTAISVGPRLGQLRTGAIGGVAAAALSPCPRPTVAIIGYGAQAEAQIAALSRAIPTGPVRVWGRDTAKCADFCNRIATHSTVQATPADTAQQAVQAADVVILATSASAPVINADWVAPHAHVTTVGPKFTTRH